MNRFAKSMLVAAVVFAGAAQSARAAVTCTLVDEKPKGGCPCLRYLVNCDGQMGWADGKGAEKSGDSITFAGDSLDLYSDRQLYPGKVKKVGTIKAKADPASCKPGKAKSTGEPSGLRATLDACNNKPIHYWAFPEEGACQNWSLCPYETGKKKEFPACNKSALPRVAPTRLGQPTRAYVPKSDSYLRYQEDTASVVTLDPGAIDPSCKHDPVRICVSRVSYEKKLSDTEFAEFGSTRIVCGADDDGACPSMDRCLADSKFNIDSPDRIFPEPPGGAKPAGPKGKTSKEAK